MRLRLMVLGALLLASPSYAGPVLIGTATLHVTDDLTVIQTATNTVQWLDLTSTMGMSIVDAATTYGAYGFHWATGAEVAELYAAFGLTYASAPNFNLATPLPAPYPNQISFMDHLGG